MPGAFSVRSLTLTRTQAVPATVLGALAVNLVIWLIGLAAGGSFEFVDENDVARKAAPMGVIVLTLGPATVGMLAAALLSLKWPIFVRIAQVIGPVLALLTIWLTIDADFDGVSTTALAAMHVVLAIALVVGLEAMYRGINVRAQQGIR